MGALVRWSENSAAWCGLAAHGKLIHQDICSCCHELQCIPLHITHSDEQQEQEDSAHLNDEASSCHVSTER